MTTTVSRLREELILAARDLADVALGRREPLVPPRRLMFDGPRDPEQFIASGREFLGYYIDLCQLKPDERILDLGSGIGRKTVPLTGYLSAEGRYVGLDVHRGGVAWCRSRISSRHANFEFRQIDVFNRRYNPRGRVQASEYEFPFADESFDLVVLASVFTHMFPDGVERYLEETARVLKSDTGRCLISYFLLGPDSEAGIAAARSDYRFSYRRKHHAVEREDRPEDVVAYEESYLRGLYRDAGLAITAVYPGSWSGRAESLSYQDLILAGKRTPPE